MRNYLLQNSLGYEQIYFWREPYHYVVLYEEVLTAEQYGL